VVTWLRANPSLDELTKAYPQEWSVAADVGKLVDSGDAAALKELVAGLARPTTALAGHRRPRPELISAEIRRQMTLRALERAALASATGVHSGRIRFNLVNGYAMQRLLFERDLVRKPVSPAWFRLVWPLLGQQRLLMPLVQKQGIYCFYSKPLIARLAALIGGRRCLEIAAGDGTLSRFLAAAGVDVTATDDHSWSDAVDYPATVLREDAGSALRTHKPQAVVCSWPPAGNRFERRVFETPGVDLYILITARDTASAGDWPAYAAQSAFTWHEDPALSKLVLPPLLDPVVLVFERTDAQAAETRPAS
jgi:hypothetical protein